MSDSEKKLEELEAILLEIKEINDTLEGHLRGVRFPNLKVRDLDMFRRSTMPKKSLDFFERLKKWVAAFFSKKSTDSS
jgi:hypothetical protein